MPSSSRTFVLKSSDGELLKMNASEAQLSVLLKHLIKEVDCSKTSIPIPNVTGYILKRVITYCRNHVNAAHNKVFLRSFDREFVNVDESTLMKFFNAAMFLEIKILITLTSQTLADRLIKGKSVEELRERFKIKSDFTAEEEAEVSRENSWAFDTTPPVSEKEVEIHRKTAW